MALVEGPLAGVSEMIETFRAARDDARPALARGRCLSLRALAFERSPAHESEQRRQQGERDQHGDDHGEGGAQAHGGQERDAGDQQADQGDDHGQPCHHHGAARGADGVPDGFLYVHALLHLLAVAGDDEQCVVDADGQAQHRRQRRRRGRQLDDACHRGERQQADRHAGDGGQQRQPGRGQSAEGHQQHHERDGDAEHLGVAALAAGAHDAAGELHLQPGLSGRLGDARQRRLRPVADLVRRNGEVDVAERDAAVLGDHRRRPRLARSPYRLRDPANERERRGQQVAVASLVEGVARRRCHHDTGAGPAGAGELLGEQVDRALSFGTRDAEGTVGRRPQGGRRGADTDQHHQPDGDHRPPVSGTPATEAIQDKSHENLASGIGRGALSSGDEERAIRPIPDTTALAVHVFVS